MPAFRAGAASRRVGQRFRGEAFERQLYLIRKRHYTGFTAVTLTQPTFIFLHCLGPSATQVIIL